MVCVSALKSEENFKGILICSFSIFAANILLLFLFFFFFFLLGISFIHISVHMSIPIAQFSTQPSPPHRSFPPLVSICPFSTSVSQLLPCKLAHLYHFSTFHIHALTYDICFSLSDLLISNCLNLPFQTQGRSRRLKPFSYKEMGDAERLLYPGQPYSVSITELEIESWVQVLIPPLSFPEPQLPPLYNGDNKPTSQAVYAK